MVWISMPASELTAEKLAKAKKSSIENTQDADDRLFETNTDKVVLDEISDDGTIHIHSDSSFGYVGMEYKLDDEDWVELMNLFIKRLNKLKTVIEALK